MSLRAAASRTIERRSGRDATPIGARGDALLLAGGVRGWLVLLCMRFADVIEPDARHLCGDPFTRGPNRQAAPMGRQRLHRLAPEQRRIVVRFALGS